MQLLGACRSLGLRGLRVCGLTHLRFRGSGGLCFRGRAGPGERVCGHARADLRASEAAALRDRGSLACWVVEGVCRGVRGSATVDFGDLEGITHAKACTARRTPSPVKIIRGLLRRVFFLYLMRTVFFAVFFSLQRLD